MGIIINKPKIELKTIIFNSSLSNKQKENWYNFIHTIIEQDAILILKTIQEDETTLNFLTENLEKKLNALKTGDKNAWKNIVKEEKEYIKSK